VFLQSHAAGTAKGSYEAIADHPGVLILSAHRRAQTAPLSSISAEKIG
jgi:hypothetical protein